MYLQFISLRIRVNNWTKIHTKIKPNHPGSPGLFFHISQQQINYIARLTSTIAKHLILKTNLNSKVSWYSTPLTYLDWAHST